MAVDTEREIQADVGADLRRALDPDRVAERIAETELRQQRVSSHPEVDHAAQLLGQLHLEDDAFSEAVCCPDRSDPVELRRANDPCRIDALQSLLQRQRAPSQELGQRTQIEGAGCSASNSDVSGIPP